MHPVHTINLDSKPYDNQYGYREDEDIEGDESNGEYVKTVITFENVGHYGPRSGDHGEERKWGGILGSKEEDGQCEEQIPS